jgi:hypothetical protein
VIKRETGFDAVGIRLRSGNDFPYFVQNGFSHDFLLTENTLIARNAEEERERRIAELQKALMEVIKLSGLLPICVSCKNIRDDKGYWRQIELYIKNHSGADFSHGGCLEYAPCESARGAQFE